MQRQVYQYVFGDEVSMAEVRDTLRLALLAAESLHGKVRLLVDADYEIDERRRTCAIDATNKAGEDLNGVFAGYVVKEFGPGSFRVQRVTRMSEALSPSFPTITGARS